MTYLDLSLPVTTGMPVYPGDPSVTLTPALSIEGDGVAVSRLDFGSHTGTHLDAPSHSIAGGRTVADIPLEQLAGPACILRARATAGEQIGAGELLNGIPDRLPLIVCIATGWDRHFASPQRTNHPFLAVELARELWERGARVLGVDMLSPDPTDGNEGPCAVGMPVHEFWLGHDGVIVENLARLTELPSEVELSLLPLRLIGGDGSPIRAVAKVRQQGVDTVREA